MDPSTFESFPVLLESNFSSSYEVKLPSPQRILSVDVAILGEETLLAGRGLKNLRQFSDDDTETLHMCLWKILAVFFVFLPCSKSIR